MELTPLEIRMEYIRGMAALRDEAREHLNRCHRDSCSQTMREYVQHTDRRILNAIAGDRWDVKLGMWLPNPN